MRKPQNMESFKGRVWKIRVGDLSGARQRPWEFSSSLGIGIRSGLCRFALAVSRNPNSVGMLGQWRSSRKISVERVSQYGSGIRTLVRLAPREYSGNGTFDDPRGSGLAVSGRSQDRDPVGQIWQVGQHPHLGRAPAVSVLRSEGVVRKKWCSTGGFWFLSPGRLGQCQIGFTAPWLLSPKA